MILDLITYIFEQTGRQWRVGGGMITPDETDLRIVLDEAAKRLYDEPVGSSMTTGGLYIEKTRAGHDIYVRVGEYT